MTEHEVPAEYRAWCWVDGTSALALEMRHVSRPKLADDEVLVRNYVAGLNPVDWKALGERIAPMKPGHIPGVDGAGIVVEVGAKLDPAWVGRRVAYHQNLIRPGSFAEYTPVQGRALMVMPDALDFGTAASMPCPALTAWQALSKLPSRVGAKLLISGAGGAVGNYLVQLAADRGFAVTVMCHERHWERLRALGAQHCLPGTAVSDDHFAEELRNQYYAVIDTVGADYAVNLAPAMKANGHIVCILGRLDTWPDPIFTRATSLHEVTINGLHMYGDDADWHDLTKAGERLLACLAEQSLHPEEMVTRSFDALPAFLNDLEHRQFTGKALVNMPVIANS
ncbi:zinc-binding dehydrogenase [Candidatus Kirkpatrickella diaphorinae]|uniref:Zinc-binding dehydrogenase n=1 Tax=Candidatus Kirkpatrickella diaphorinae TaxID=2984322 RepID=A0ABY6GH47_9PROT|nr:zinc-binding dehydrogenase [Candidatus Kirkpatrickella diaphorinae]UYH50838.1 zinc-binding dehydrogenase [Candidatus Kirkpatrickella diaphorinae]